MTASMTASHRPPRNGRTGDVRIGQLEPIMRGVYKVLASILIPVDNGQSPSTASMVTTTFVVILW